MKTRHAPALLLAGLSAALPLLCGGCAGYRLGSMLPEGVASLNVPTFVNKTKEPLLEVETTRAAIEEFQKDGSLKVVGELDADAILEVTLSEFRLDPVAYRKDTRTAAKQYRMIVYASIVLKRRSDSTVIMQAPKVRGEAVFDVLGDLSSSKQQVLPIAARDLAHNIVERVVEYW
jgi:hypothetical protein